MMELTREAAIRSHMKRDGRTFDHATLEIIRLMAIERVREGESPAAVIASYGFNRTTIYKWIKAARQPGVGIKALRSTKATGRPRTLTAAQERQVFRWINGRDPRQYGLDFGLWTRAVVVELIARKFGVTLGVTAVGELLAKLGLTPQKPLQRAISETLRRLSGGNEKRFLPLPGRRGTRVQRFSSGTNRAFVPTLCTARPAVYADRLRWLNVLDSGNRSTLRLRSMRTVRSGSAPTVAPSTPNCS